MRKFWHMSFDNYNDRNTPSASFESQWEEVHQAYVVLFCFNFDPCL